MLARSLLDGLAADIAVTQVPAAGQALIGRPPTNMFDLLLVGFVMGMTGLSARQASAAVQPPNVTAPVSSHTVSRRLAGDLLPLLPWALSRSTDLVIHETGSPDVVKIDLDEDILPQLVPKVGIGRARRKDDRGLLVDALCRSIGVNMKIFGAAVDEGWPQPPCTTCGRCAGWQSPAPLLRGHEPSTPRSIRVREAMAKLSRLKAEVAEYEHRIEDFLAGGPDPDAEASAPQPKPPSAKVERHNAAATVDALRRRGRARSLRGETPGGSPGLAILRPQTRADCSNGPRPCPWVGCRHHLTSDAASCVLDVVEGLGGATLQIVSELVGISRQTAANIETKAIRRIRKHFADYDDRGTSDSGWSVFDGTTSLGLL